MLILRICLILAFVVWALMEAYKDAHLFHNQSIVSPAQTPPHALFTAHRLIFGALVYYICQDWLFCLSLILCFSFIHNSFYFHLRHKLNPEIYPLGWKDDSITSSALFDLSFFARVVLAQIGLVLLSADLVIYP